MVDGLVMAAIIPGLTTSARLGELFSVLNNSGFGSDHTVNERALVVCGQRSNRTTRMQAPPRMAAAACASLTGHQIYEKQTSMFCHNCLGLFAWGWLASRQKENGYENN